MCYYCDVDEEYAYHIQDEGGHAFPSDNDPEFLQGRK